VVLGGGFYMTTVNPDIEVVRAYPSSDTAYTVTMVEDTSVSGNWSFTVWAVCA
jgi:hypothetical protein